nr:alkaline phosphatase family protein [Halomicroarcula sp. SYNS111]
MLCRGKNPGKLGVYWWERIDTDNQMMELPDSTDFTSPELWDYVNDSGENVGVINLPMSYPPREVDGFMIAGGPRSRERNYTSPSSLQQEVERRFDYRVHPENVLTSNEDAGGEVEMIHDLLRTRLQTAYTLLEEQDVTFLHLTLFHLNVLQHYFWDGPETQKAWEIIDEELERFVEADCNLVLMSDHGCTEIDTVFYINEWLERNGYLQTESSVASRLFDIGITQERIAEIVRAFNLEQYIRPLVPRPIIERFPSDEGVVREEKLSMVDWENTTAIGSGQGLVYIVADSESEHQRIFDALRDDLTAATGQNGKPVVKSVHAPDEIYHGEYLDRAPDLMFDQRPGVHTSEAMGHGEVFSTPTNWRGENVPDGMVLFHGEDVSPGNLDPIRISDIGPTILHWMGLAVPTDMDGDPKTAVFDKATDPAGRPVEHRPPLHSHDDERGGRDLDDEVADRLEDIGYLE